MGSSQKRMMWCGLLFILSLGVLLIGLPVCVDAAPKPIKIGVSGPMTIIVGKQHWRGAVVAAEEINAAGGINVGGVRRPIELVKGDSNEYRSVPDAASTMEKLLTLDKVDFVVGGVRSEAVLAQQEVMADYKKIFIDCGSAHPEQVMRVGRSYDKYKYYFRTVPDGTTMFFSQFSIINMVAVRVREELGIQTPKVALLMEKAKYTEPGIQYANALLPKMGMEIVGVWRPSAHATDVMAELTAIKSAGAQIIYVVTSGSMQNTLSKQWGEQKIPAAMVGYLGQGVFSGHWEISGGTCNYALSTCELAYVEATPRTKPFIERFRKKYNESPARTACTYDAISLLKDAVERAGSMDTDAVIASLEKADFPGAQGRIVFFPKGHKWAHGVIVSPKHLTWYGLQWRDGKQVNVWPDGRALHPVLSKDPGWKDIRFEGTVDYKLPPWLIKYWKDKK